MPLPIFLSKLCRNSVISMYSETCLKRPLKIDKTKVLKPCGSSMQVESIAECSPWSILQYFWAALSNNWS